MRVLFPGWITHKTQASKTNEDRIVFTINIGAVDQGQMLQQPADLHIQERLH